MTSASYPVLPALVFAAAVCATVNPEAAARGFLGTTRSTRKGAAR